VSDARFEDGGDKPLRLKALDTHDLTVLSSLTQDAVFPASEMKWDRKARRFAVLINSFRWADDANVKGARRQVERVQSVLSIEDVTAVQTQGVQAGDADMVLSLLAITFEAGLDGTSRIILTLSGDGAIGVDVEAVEVLLRDVTRPYIAPSRKVPKHD